MVPAARNTLKTPHESETATMFETLNDAGYRAAHFHYTAMSDEALDVMESRRSRALNHRIRRVKLNLETRPPREIEIELEIIQAIRHRRAWNRFWN